MAILDPVAAYIASSDVEAHIVCGVLVDAGIEAVAIEDVSRAGVWMFGTIPALHRPQVWIDRRDIDQARPVLEEYMRLASERRVANRARAETADETIEVTCEECGKPSMFPAAQKGSVQNCPHCFAYVDVGDNEAFDGSDEIADNDEPEP